ncbi:MAG TPA: hypothetical protein VG013_09965 [Gemmataceae bacterium]|nr:hypothetical protein [Gemmataceae bacterium]
MDPRKSFREGPRKVANRKALQLCGQVARTLNEVLHVGCGDDVLRDLMVEAVVPAPDSTRLLVTVCCSPASAPIESGRVLEHLAGAHAMLRLEVAAAIHRKKVPELSFRVADRGDVNP